MYVGRDYDVGNPGESEVFGLDFVNDLTASETLSAVAWTLSTVEGSDPVPATHVDGLPGVVGTIALQRLSGLVGGNNYLLQASARTNLGNTKILFSHIRCQTPI